MSELNVSVVDAAPAGNVEPQAAAETNPVESVRTEVAPVAQEQPTMDKPKQTPEENARYAEVRRKAAEEAKTKERDAVVAEMYGESLGLHTWADYQKAIDSEKTRAAAAKLAEEQQIPETVAQELLENRKFKEAAAKQQQEAEQKAAENAKKDAEYNAFFDLFRQENNREFDAGKDQLPDEVWSAFNQGTPLKYAYLEYRHAQLKAGIKTIEQNTKAAEAATGSVKGQGSPESDFVSQDTFEANRNNQKWVMNNLEKITRSRQKWR